MAKLEKKTPKGEKYFMYLIDDFTRATGIVLLKEKLEEFNNFKKFIVQVDIEKDVKVRFFGSDRGGDYT